MKSTGLPTGLKYSSPYALGHSKQHTNMSWFKPQKGDRSPKSNRQLKRHFLALNISANTVKWLGRYDLAMNNKLYPTGVRSISDLTYDQWVSLVNRINLMPDDTHQVINGNIAG